MRFLKGSRVDEKIVVYGSNWCGYTVRVLRHLENLGVEFRYVDVDESPEDENRIADWNNGRSIRPTIDLSGDVFVNPSPAALEAELKKRGLLA
jgi:glutaredoxin